VMDGGGNPVGQLDVDSSGAGLRREIEVVVSGSLIQTSTSELDAQKVLLTPGGAVAVDVASASTTTFAVSIGSSTLERPVLMTWSSLTHDWAHITSQ